MVTAPKKSKTPNTDPQDGEVARPNPQATEENTPQTTLPQDDNLDTRADENIQLVVRHTGQNVSDVETLVAETVDQLTTEAVANKYRDDVKLDTLSLEQLDHQRTLKAALGLSADYADNDTLMANAKERADSLKGKKRDDSKDNVHNSIPANWRIKPAGDDTIEAVNVVTGKQYSGDPKGLFKGTADVTSRS